MLREENPVVVQEVVEDKFLTSGNGVKIQVPSVISLKNYVNIVKKRQASGAKRVKIYIRDSFRCGYCAKKFEGRDLTLDHIVPKSKGGQGIPENLVTACKPCNQRKADRTPDEARMPLLTTIHDTRDIGLDKVLICHYAESRPEWKPYLFGQEGFDEILKTGTYD
jgi:5-methylcytosine-specific restriction endonuclease McrA